MAGRRRLAATSAESSVVVDGLWRRSGRRGGRSLGLACGGELGWHRGLFLSHPNSSSPPKG